MKTHEHTLLVQAIEEDDSEAGDVMRAHIQTSLGARSAWRLSKPGASAGDT
jgi:DNA-binding GntR family transcriptional regulator